MLFRSIRDTGIGRPSQVDFDLAQISDEKLAEEVAKEVANEIPTVFKKAWSPN